MSTVAPLSFQYNQLPSSISSRKRTRRFQPTNGDKFSPSTTSVVRIPVRSENYLDGSNSYLKMKLKNKELAGVTLKLDTNASAVISKIRILCGGVVCEEIDRLNVLTSMLTMAQGSEDYHKSLQICANQSIADQDQTALLIGTAIAGQDEITVCIPLFSGLLNCGKYLPLGLFQNNALTIELYLESAVHVGVWASAPVSGGYEISNVEYIANMIEIGDDATNKALEMQMLNHGLEFHGSTYSAHINSLSATSTGASINIPERCSSLKALITVVRPSDSTFAFTSLQSKYPHTVGGTDFNWFYRIGSENLPQMAVGSSGESFLEFQKAFNNLWSLNQSTYANWLRWNADWDADINAGCYNMTISTESFSHTSSMESGLDTATGAKPITLMLSGIDLTGHAAEVITYSYKDIIWSFKAGQFQVSL
jgi:hypothetical protein